MQIFLTSDSQALSMSQQMVLCSPGKRDSAAPRARAILGEGEPHRWDEPRVGVRFTVLNDWWLDKALNAEGILKREIMQLICAHSLLPILVFVNFVGAICLDYADPVIQPSHKYGDARARNDYGTDT